MDLPVTGCTPDASRKIIFAHAESINILTLTRKLSILCNIYPTLNCNNVALWLKMAQTSVTVSAIGVVVAVVVKRSNRNQEWDGVG